MDGKSRETRRGSCDDDEQQEYEKSNVLMQKNIHEAPTRWNHLLLIFLEFLLVLNQTPLWDSKRKKWSWIVTSKEWWKSETKDCSYVSIQLRKKKRQRSVWVILKNPHAWLTEEKLRGKFVQCLKAMYIRSHKIVQNWTKSSEFHFHKNKTYLNTWDHHSDSV